MKRIVLGLMAMLLVAAAVAACTSETGPPAGSPAMPTPTPTATPTPTPTPTPESAGAAIQALTQQVGNLAKQVEALAASNEMLAGQLGATPASPTSPPAASAPAPTGSGICGRSPATQRAILETLGLRSCQFITNDELYRITLWGNSTSSSYGDRWRSRPPYAGDFAGLVNLEYHVIRGDYKLLAGTFSGLTGLKALEISVSGLEEGAFQGLTGLEYLDITLRYSYNSENFPVVLRLPVFDEMPNLKSLIIDSDGNYAPTLEITPGLFDNLPNLEALEIEWRQRGDDTRRTFRLPANLFQHNPNLKDVEIRIHGGYLDITAPVDLFAGLDHLEELRIYASNSSSTLSLALSTKSPLFNALINGERSREGYEIVWPE